MTIALTTIRYYTQLDPYFYTVDNRPLQDLESRDNQLNAELDRRTFCVDVTGAASPTTVQMPTGWSIAVNGTGDYTITHNLGYSTYVAVGGIINSAGGTVSITSFDNTTIRLVARNLAGTATHLRFQLRVTGY